ncbi:MAG: hypothetical protein GY940_24220 [bacterium]|nr:hypothetical protein [bacterium]
MMEVFQEIMSLLPKDKEGKDAENVELDEIGDLVTSELLRFDKIDKMADIIAAGLYNANRQLDDFEDDEIQTALFNDFEILTIAFQELFKSMPKADKPEEIKKKRGPRTTAATRKRKK